MCGIFGMFGESSAAERAAAASRAIDLLRHRGPDDAGSVDVGEGVLVNRRLAIVDLAPTGHQPMQSPDGRVSLVFNGEIYNYLELQREHASRYPFRGHSDTEAIVAAYLTWGDEFLQHLRGMFALALWDRERHRLLVATDRSSIKPVVFHSSGGRLIFASEVKPLAAAGVPLRVNERRVFDYLKHGLLDHSTDTLFDGVSQLRPGTFLTYERGSIAIRTYWDLADRAGEDTPWTGDASLDAIADLLEEAVDLHLRGDVEPALSLSSGLDSQVLRAVIQRGDRRRGLHCFTYCFPGTPYDECEGARAIAERAPIEWTGTVIEPTGLLDNLETLVAGMEAPVGGLGIYGYWLNCRSVADAGYKVLLDGQGSDEAFAGYRYYYGALLGDLARRGDTAGLAAELAAFNAVHGTNITWPSAAADALLGSADASVRAPDGTSLESHYIAPEFEAAWRAAPVPALPAPFADSVKNAMYRDLFYFKIPKLLRFQDRAAMLSSVEVRVPYLDHVLLEALARVPSRILLSHGVTKALLRTIGTARFDTAMPQAKLYVAAPQREWLKTVLRADCVALISASRLAADGYVDARALRQQYDRYCESPELGNSFFIWKFINLELWYRRFVVSTASSSVRTPHASHA